MVPAKPKLLTAARRTGAFQGSHRVATRTGYTSQGMRGEGVVKFRCGKIVAERICSSALMTPTRPEAGSMWPRLVLTEPTISGSSLVWVSANTLLMAPISMGSPSGVPVPCAST